MRRLAILTENKYLYQKLYLLFCCDGDFEISAPSEADTVLADIDTVKAPVGAVTLSRNSSLGADITLPSSFDKLKAAVSVDGGDEITIDRELAAVTLKGHRHRLTELEFSLFSLLAERGDFVSRAEILSTVWGGKTDEGIINVYIHYLRAKLEADGEKIIISSRKSGYRISEKYKIRW